jgi:hypothetical protein
VESTQTTPAARAGGPQERQLIAGRYRLASFHRGDDITEVWRALDESANKVVSLEFLRDRDPAARERFVAAGRRMASVEQPSVMKVAAVHDDAYGTFIVFEHLIHIPVPLDWLKLADQPPAPILNVPASAGTEALNAKPAAPPPTTETPAVAAEGPASLVADERPTDRGLSLLMFALRKRELSLIDQALLEEAAFEFLRIVQSSFEDVRVDPTFIAEVRALPRRLTVGLVASAVARVAAAAGRLGTVRPNVRLRAPHLSRPRPVKVPRVKAAAPAKQASARAPALPRAVPVPHAPAVPRAPRISHGLGLRVRWGRVLTRGLSLGLLAAILIALPSELIGTMGNMANDLTVTIREKLATLSSGSGLQRASFEVPPLGAYGAAFEAQAPYPTARPNGTVEWVVALRNTGSAGWYRGIDGAQASLMLADGTTAGVQTTAYVGPGQVGWFVVHFPAPSQPGVSRVVLLPRIDGRGSLPDLGIYAAVTVSPNP